jgi:hypothetical protein
VTTNSSLTFFAPTCTAIKRVNIIDDNIYEERESFHFILTSDQPRVQVNSTLPHGDIVIRDRDGEPLRHCTIDL